MNFIKLVLPWKLESIQLLNKELRLEILLRAGNGQLHFW